MKEGLTLQQLAEMGASPIKSDYFMKTMTIEQLKELGASPIVPKVVEPIIEKVIEKTIETIIVDDEKLQELSDKLENETKANKGVFDALNNYIKEVKATIKRLEHNVMNSYTAGVSPLVTQSNGSTISSFTGVLNFIGATLSARRDGGVDVTITSSGGINEDSFGLVVDGAGVPVTTGSKGYKYIPWDCTITGWSILGDISGSAVIDVKRSGVSLAGTEKPTLVTATANQDLALSTWTTSLLAGDVIEFIVDSASTLTRATLTILVTKV